MRYAHAFPPQVRRRRNSFIAYARWVSDPRRRVLGLSPPSMSRRLPRARAASEYNSGATQLKTLCNSGREGNISRSSSDVTWSHAIKLRDRMQKVRTNLDVANPARKIDFRRLTRLRLNHSCRQTAQTAAACHGGAAARRLRRRLRKARSSAGPVSTRLAL